MTSKKDDAEAWLSAGEPVSGVLAWDRALHAGVSEIICTKEQPWNGVLPPNTRVVHPDALDDGECADGCCDQFKCPHCGHWWRNEAAQ